MKARAELHGMMLVSSGFLHNGAIRRTKELLVMPSTGLLGPFPLTSQGIDIEITRTSPGAYALGSVDMASVFHVNYVGRSDDDLAKRLKQHVTAYKHFKYGCYASPKGAFEKECNLYHDFSPAANKVHPARPSGANWRCPRCRVFG
jgi:hypothetical protein